VTQKAKIQISTIQKEFYQIWNQRKKDSYGLFNNGTKTNGAALNSKKRQLGMLEREKNKMEKQK
jgi:hypothetical protein